MGGRFRTARVGGLGREIVEGGGGRGSYEGEERGFSGVAGTDEEEGGEGGGGWGAVDYEVEE